MQKLYSYVVVFTVLVLKWLCLHMWVTSVLCYQPFFSLAVFLCKWDFTFVYSHGSSILLSPVVSCISYRQCSVETLCLRCFCFSFEQQMKRGYGTCIFLYSQLHPGWMYLLENEWQSPVWIPAETKLQTIHSVLSHFSYQLGLSW